MNYSSFFIPYISNTHTKEDLIELIENNIGQVLTIDIVLSKKGKYMAFIHMASIYISDKTQKILSIIDEHGQYYLYDITKRMNLVFKRMKPKNEKPIYQTIEKKIEDLNIKINKKIIGVYTEIENIKQILYDIQRKIYGYSISSVRIGNIENDMNWS
jgi:hypothetical protein